MTEPTHPPAPRSSAARIVAVVVLVLVVVGIIAVAFRGSWGSLRDAALAAHFDRDGADLYPFAVDGLLVVAILAAVLLRHDRGARRYCLGIIIGYTGASWLINYLHGLGRFSVDPVTGIRPGPPWFVVMLIAALLIGSIFLGTHLLVHVVRHVFPNAVSIALIAPAYRPGTEVDRDVPDVPEPPADNLAAARDAYRHSCSPGYTPLSQRKLVNRYGITKRQAGAVQSEVKAELADGAGRKERPEVPAVPDRDGQGTA